MILKNLPMGYINGANNWTEESAEFKIYQGYLKEVEIERIIDQKR